MLSALSRLILKIWGFRIEGNVGNHLPKKIFVVVPHTSSWDFPLGILIRNAKRIQVNFLGKESLFKPPFGFVFRWLGGHPVDRSQRNQMVEYVVKLYNEHERFGLAVAPEGTRQKVNRLKTGFYHISRLAKVPIIMIRLDYENGIIGFSDAFYPSGDQVKDFRHIHQFFKGVKGKYAAASFNPA
ncbi:MAG: 1-acyl-sn-glycerol-3-phosphate acyltransferase [Saprospiraceae bacterium]|nr:1-acyl-sn-glycerol-3-phosphate acyltransferase [Saprospiraceae bacterium]